MAPHDERVSFRGGIYGGVIPLAVFLALTMYLVVRGAAVVEGMIIAAMIGISIGMLLSANVAHYSERVFSLMANRVATVAIVCWLWAGAFSGILSASGLVEAIVWLGWKANLSGGAFTVAVFISAAMFAVFTGTGLGTTIGFTAVMYPAGLVLGADPSYLMGAIISGGAFGDNLAPISDTTIVSAATQEADVGGVVASRLKYVLIAASLAAALFFVLGGRGGIADQGPEGQALLEQTADPKGLPMLIPSLLVFIVAVSGGHFLAALTAGVVASVILGPILGIFEVGSVVTIAEGSVTGSAVAGAMGLVPTAILTLLLVTAIGLMADSGFLDTMMAWLNRTVARSVKGAELSIIALTSFTNLCVSVNTVAMVTAGPLANVLRKQHGVHPYRSANLMDTVSCSWPYILPYSAIIPAAIAQQEIARAQYPFVEVLSWSQMAPYMFYGHILFPLMILFALTGFGSRRG